jgi:hypothetical protein
MTASEYIAKMNELIIEGYLVASVKRFGEPSAVYDKDHKLPLSLSFLRGFMLTGFVESYGEEHATPVIHRAMLQPEVKRGMIIDGNDKPIPVLTDLGLEMMDVALMEYTEKLIEQKSPLIQPSQ